MTEIERTPAGLQIVMPGCESRTIPKSTSPADAEGQGLFLFYRPPSLREAIAHRADAPLRAKRPQKALPGSGLFGC